MKKNIIKIVAGVFLATLLTSCSEMDAYKFLIMGNKTGNWGNDTIDLFGRDEDDKRLRAGRYHEVYRRYLDRGQRPRLRRPYPRRRAEGRYGDEDTVRR